MSDVTITMSESEARNLLATLEGSAIERDHCDVAAAIRRALPPEWEEGTLAVVTDRTGLTGYAKWDGRVWRTAAGLPLGAVTNVEPIRVLKDDEIAVKPISTTSPANVAAWRSNADYMREQGHSVVARLCDRYADAMTEALTRADR